jgi:hypothetical protein
MLFGYIANADTILLDPIFKPPQFTSAARPTCPSTFGCFGFNSDLKKFEWNDGVLWQAFGTGLLDEWVAGKNYVVGEIKNTGSDKNWLFKVVQDHTSANVPADMKAGKILAIAPPIITTGIQDGGHATLAGTVATVQSGTGYIAKYGLAPSAFPRITIVEWVTQTVTLPATGIFTLYITDTGTLTFSAGIAAGAERSALDDKISVGVVDMNLGQAYDSETYPTNPVGQLRGLALFFGGMTKGLTYTATGLQLARSAYEQHYWGANTTNPYAPNSKQSPALTPVTFYEFTQNGVVLPNTTRTTLRTDVYDNGGALIPLSNNKWGFVRIYTTLGTDDYVMYSQAEYFTKKDAEAGAIAGDFIKPLDLQLTKFSAWSVYEKGDLDLSDNLITVCEPFGCDKIGTGSGGGGGAGDVLGPASSVASRPALFGDTSGKVLVDDSNVTFNYNYMTVGNSNNESRLYLDGNASSGQSPFIAWEDTGGVGRTIKLGMSSGMLANYNLFWPLAAPTAGQVLRVSNAQGQMDWTTVTSGGDVSSAGSNFKQFQLASFDSTTGKLITNGNGNQNAPQMYQTNLYLNGSASILFGYQPNGAAYTTLDQPSIYWMYAGAKSISLAANPTAPNATYKLTLPTTAPTGTQILQTDGTGQLSWIPTPVDTNTITTVIDNLTSSSTTSALSANQGRILDGRVTTNATNITTLQGQSHTHTNKTLLDSLTSAGSGTAYLANDGTYKTIAVATGDVVGPAGATDNAIARFDTGTGKLIQNSSVTIADNGHLSIPVAAGTGGPFLEFAPGLAGKETNAGRIAYNAFSQGVGNTGSLNISGGGTTGTNRSTRFWDRVGIGMDPTNALDVSGVIAATGNITAVGQILSIPPAVKSDLIFDFNNGNNQYTTANCGAVQLNNTIDGGVYSIVLAGATPALCSFTGTPSFTVHMPVPHGSTTAATGKVTIYYFTRLNGHMMIGWSTGI